MRHTFTILSNKSVKTVIILMISHLHESQILQVET